MLKGLDELNFELELKDSNIREIVKAYHKAGLERIDVMVLRPLEEKHPRLRDFFDSIRNIEDPIAHLKEQEVTIKEFDRYNAVLALIPSSVSIDNIYAKNLRGIMSEVNDLSNLVEKYCPISKQFYLSVSREVRKIALNEGISIEQIVRNTGYMDEIIKGVFPERQEAEKYFRTSERLGMEALMTSNNFIVYCGKLGIDIPQALKIIPTQEDLSMVQQTMLNYKMAEFDRIYSR